MSIVKLKDAAVKEVESIFTQSGYIDWESIRPSATATDDENERVIKAQTKPIFYRATTPAAAPAAVIKKQGEPKQASLFLLYGLLAAQFISADDKTVSITQPINITIQYNTKYLFYKSKENHYTKYLEDLLNNLKSNGWSLTETLAEQPFEATEGSNIFNYRNQYIASKIF
jgi:hypothetical protein